MANAGLDQEVTAGDDGFATVVLEGSGSADPDGDSPLQFWWTLEGALLATGVQPMVELPPGRFPITLVVRDPADNVGTDEVMVTVNDQFLRGDSNGDDQIDVSDAVFTLLYLFTDRVQAQCLDALDANDDGALDISDAIFTLGFLFLDLVPTLPGPSPGRGLDPTPDSLGCTQY